MSSVFMVRKGIFKSPNGGKSLTAVFDQGKGEFIKMPLKEAEGKGLVLPGEKLCSGRVATLDDIIAHFNNCLKISK